MTGGFSCFFPLFFLRSNSLEWALKVDGVLGHLAGWIVFGCEPGHWRGIWLGYPVAQYLDGLAGSVGLDG